MPTDRNITSNGLVRTTHQRPSTNIEHETANRVARDCKQEGRSISKASPHQATTRNDERITTTQHRRLCADPESKWQPAHQMEQHWIRRRNPPKPPIPRRRRWQPSHHTEKQEVPQTDLPCVPSERRLPTKSVSDKAIPNNDPFTPTAPRRADPERPSGTRNLE